MKPSKIDYYKEILSILKELKALKPEIDMGTHIATATSEFKDIWGVSDKDFFKALTEYKAQFELFETEDNFQIEETFSLDEEEEY